MPYPGLELKSLSKRTRLEVEQAWGLCYKTFMDQ